MPDITWKIVQRLEEMADQLETMHNHMMQTTETHKAINQWIQEATTNIIDMENNIKYLMNKKDCI